MYQPSCVFTSSIGYVGGPGSGTAMLAVELLVAAEWRAPNGSVMALKLQHDRFQSAYHHHRLLRHARQHCSVSVHVCVSIYV